jgi:phage/plasmid-like protein (TIGR03299 family)
MRYKIMIKIITNNSTPSIKIASQTETPRPKPTGRKVITSTTRSIFSSLTHLSSTDIEGIAEEAGFDFTARKIPLKYTGMNEELFINPEKVAVVRDNNTFLGTIGKDRPIVQYTDTLRFTEVLVEQGLANYMHGGIINNGRCAYLTMKAAHHISLTPGDEMECYFYLVTSHDSTKALKIIPSPMRGNTVLVLPGLQGVTFRHTKNINNRMVVAKSTIGKMKNYFDDFEKSFRKLATVKCNDKLLDMYLRAVYPDSKGEKNTRTENTREDIAKVLRTEPSLQLPSCKNTLFGAYMAVCVYADHFMTVNKTGKQDEMSARISSRLSGAAAKRKAEALGTAEKIKEKFAGVGTLQ